MECLEIKLSKTFQTRFRAKSRTLSGTNSKTFQNIPKQARGRLRRPARPVPGFSPRGFWPLGSSPHGFSPLVDSSLVTSPHGISPHGISPHGISLHGVSPHVPRCCGDNPCGETMCGANQRGENPGPVRAGVRSRPRACFGMFWNVLEFVPLGVLDFGRNRVWKVLESLISKHSKIFPKWGSPGPGGWSQAA